MARSIGLDIGGTKIAGGLIDESGRVVRRASVPTPAHDPEGIVAAVAELVDELGADDLDAGLGVACAGYLDAERQHVRFAPNLAWRDFPLRDLVAQATGRATLIENDANAAAFGEHRFGAGRGSTNTVLVTLGTGVGGGIVLDGQLYRGAFGIGGEIGHIVVERDGRACGCGNAGCLEVYSSGSALLRSARERVEAADAEAALLTELCGGDATKLTGHLITQAAHDADPLARKLIGDVGRWLGEGLASISAVLDPGLYVVGGGVGEAGDLVLEPARAAYATHLTGTGHRPVAAIVQAELGNDAGMIGAAALAQEDR